MDKSDIALRSYSPVVDAILDAVATGDENCTYECMHDVAAQFDRLQKASLGRNPSPRAAGRFYRNVLSAAKFMGGQSTWSIKMQASYLAILVAKQKIGEVHDPEILSEAKETYDWVLGRIKADFEKGKARNDPEMIEIKHALLTIAHTMAACTLPLDHPLGPSIWQGCAMHYGEVRRVDCEGFFDALTGFAQEIQNTSMSAPAFAKGLVLGIYEENVAEIAANDIEYGLWANACLAKDLSAADPIGALARANFISGFAEYTRAYGVNKEVTGMADWLVDLLRGSDLSADLQKEAERFLQQREFLIRKPGLSQRGKLECSTAISQTLEPIRAAPYGMDKSGPPPGTALN